MGTKVNGVATPEMMNAIRAEATAEYKNAVPEATPFNLQEVGNPILTYNSVTNEFVDALVNKIIATIAYRMNWENPLSPLRKDAQPLGMDIEEVQTNPAKAQEYDGTNTGMAALLTVNKPDSKAAWYRLNRKDKYTVTIERELLTNAFTSWDNLDNYIGQVVDSLYNGNTIDEYVYTKQLITDAINANHINQFQVTNPVDQATSTEFAKELRSLSVLFTFPSTKYNNYVAMGGTGARTSWTPVDRQVILISAKVATTVGFDVLSAAFNLSYSDYLARQIIVDEFDQDGKVLAVLTDTRAFQIREKLRQFATFYNPSALAWQYYYHAWDTFSLSPFHNLIALTTK